MAIEVLSVARWGMVLVSLAPLLICAETKTVTPYRPTVSNPAELPALRQLETEIGVQFNCTGATDERLSFPFLLKYAFHDSWGLLVGSEAWIREESSGEINNSYGDTAVLMKYFLPITPGLALGLEGGAVLPSADQPIGAGRTDYLINAIVSKDFEDLRIDVNAGVTRLGYALPDDSRYRLNWAVAASYPLSTSWGIAGEFSGTYISSEKTSAQWLFAINYSVTPQWVLDFGSSVSLTSGTGDYGIFAGFSYLFGS